MGKRMRIGELTELARVTPRAVRDHQSMGLNAALGSVKVTVSTTTRKRRLPACGKIGQLKKIGLGLDEIRDVIDLYFTDPTGVQPKKKVLAILRQHLAIRTRRSARCGSFDLHRGPYRTLRDVACGKEGINRFFDLNMTLTSCLV